MYATKTEWDGWCLQWGKGFYKTFTNFSYIGDSKLFYTFVCLWRGIIIKWLICKIVGHMVLDVKGHGMLQGYGM